MALLVWIAIRQTDAQDALFVFTLPFLHATIGVTLFLALCWKSSHVAGRSAANDSSKQ